MPVKPIDTKATADKLAQGLSDALAVIKHSMYKEAVRQAANSYTPWSMASGGDDAYSDRYMKNIGKGNIAEQQQNMRDVADEESAKKSGGGTPMPSYKKGGIVKKTGPALVHEGEEVIPRDKVGKKRSKKVAKRKPAEKSIKIAGRKRNGR